MVDQISDLKKRLIESASICEMERLCEAFGHVSARIPGTDHFIMTPAGAPGGAKLSEIVKLDIRGNKIGGRGKPNVELPIHTAIYRARDDVQSVVHVHPPTLIAFSIAGREIFPMRYSDRRFSPSVPIFGDPGTEVFIDSEELGEKMALALGKRHALLIRGHGAVTVGDSIEAACINAVNLERTAEIQFMASLLLLSRSIKEDFQTPLLYERGVGDLKGLVQKRYWDFYRAKLRTHSRKQMNSSGANEG